MSSPRCVDASLVLKLVLEEEDSEKAHALWASWVADGVEIIAPCQLGFELDFIHCERSGCVA